MGTTKIEWCDMVWNPVTGCDPVSEGCAHCWARRMAKRLQGRYGYPEAPDEFKVTLHRHKLDQPYHWRKSRRVFVVSMGDLFHDALPAHVVGWIFNVMRNTPRHTYMILTKRPERMQWFIRRYSCWGLDPWPLPNVWLMVTAENEPRWRERVAVLRQIPAAVRGVSCEPLLGEICFEDGDLTDIDWVIAGAETGPGARYMDPAWARSIRNQCKAAGVPFFFKRMSPGEETPADLMMREFPKEGE